MNLKLREKYRIPETLQGPRTNIVQDEKSDLFTYSDNILTRWRNHFSQLLNAHGANDVKQTEIHAAEPVVPELSAFEVEMAIEMLKRLKKTT